MALRQHRHAGHTARLEVMQVDMQERCARGFNAPPQRRLDVLDVIEPLGAVQVDDQMHAGEADAVTYGEVVLAIVCSAIILRRRRRSCHFKLVFLSSFRAVPGISPSPSPIARGRSGSCRPPQPEIRTRDAGKPAPRNANAARSVHMK